MSYNDDVAVAVNHLSKAYKIFETPGKRLAYHLFHTKTGRDFWALKDVSFEIKKGETFGIVGKNGSGKSTMLQVLAGILKPTEGEVYTCGKIAALLELGSGFNPESTGYENIYMNAAVLGVKKKEIESKVQEIIDFADIGDFIDQPVKTYSSGMYIRLAFAVAINVDAEIILIDEALAVGDVFFRQKCYAKLNELKKQGKTIILVSHGMNEVEQFCDRALLLSHGKMEMLAPSREVVKLYYILDQKTEQEAPDSESTKEEEAVPTLDQQEFEDWKVQEDIFYNLEDSVEISNGKARFEKIGLFDDEGYPKRVFKQGEKAVFYYEVRLLEDVDVPIAGTVIFDQRNTIIHGKNSLQVYSELPSKLKKGTLVKAKQEIELDIAIGEYTFEAGFSSMKLSDYEARSERNQELVDLTTEPIVDRANAGSFSVHGKPYGDPMQMMFHGCCDLPGSIEMAFEDGE